LRKSILLIATNASIATFLAATLGGWRAALLALVGVLALALAPFWLGPVYRIVIVSIVDYAIHSAVVAWRILRPVISLVVLPVAAPLTMLLALILHVVRILLYPVEQLVGASRKMSMKFMRRLSRYFATYLVLPALPLTIANVVAVAIIICAAANVEFAGYLVFASVPMMIIILVASSLDAASRQRS
jgi:hypothetical protein